MFSSTCLTLPEIFSLAGEVLWKASLVWSIPITFLFIAFLLGFSRLKKYQSQKSNND